MVIAKLLILIIAHDDFMTPDLSLIQINQAKVS